MKRTVCASTAEGLHASPPEKSGRDKRGGRACGNLLEWIRPALHPTNFVKEELVVDLLMPILDGNTCYLHSTLLRQSLGIGVITAHVAPDLLRHNSQAVPVPKIGCRLFCFNILGRLVKKVGRSLPPVFEDCHGSISPVWSFAGGPSDLLREGDGLSSNESVGGFSSSTLQVLPRPRSCRDLQDNDRLDHEVWAASER